MGKEGWPATAVKAARADGDESAWSAARPMRTCCSGLTLNDPKGSGRLERDEKRTMKLSSHLRSAHEFRSHESCRQLLPTNCEGGERPWSPHTPVNFACVLTSTRPRPALSLNSLSRRSKRLWPVLRRLSACAPRGRLVQIFPCRCDVFPRQPPVLPPCSKFRHLPMSN